MRLSDLSQGAARHWMFNKFMTCSGLLGTDLTADKVRYACCTICTQREQSASVSKDSAVRCVAEQLAVTSVCWRCLGSFGAEPVACAIADRAVLRMFG